MPTLAVNKRAKFDYEILETFEAGLILSGQEVKSIRLGHSSLQGAYVTLDRKNEVYLTNANISAYKQAGPLPNYDPTRPRKLLINKKEIDYLAAKMSSPGLTLIPLSFYTKNNRIKVEIALAKGKKKFDKRQSIKEREEKRKVQTLLKSKMQSRG